MVATLQNKPEATKPVKRSNGEKKSNGSGPAPAGEEMVENVDVKDEPLVEAIDQYNQYDQPHGEVEEQNRRVTSDAGRNKDVQPISTNGKSLAIQRQGREPADPDSPSPVFTDRQAFLIALGFRSLSLASQTFFQPDEFYQSLEPAHWLVFGTGFLSWEWRDLPALSEETLRTIIERGGWRSKLVRLVGTQAGGRLRSWLWPGVFALVYKSLQLTGLDDTRLLVRFGSPSVGLSR